jgi:hypothetical protein
MKLFKEPKMKLFRISQTENNGYDTYDSAVVVAASEEEARTMHPSGYDIEDRGDYLGTWVKPEDVKVEYLGESISTTSYVVCASFNAG